MKGEKEMATKDPKKCRYAIRILRYWEKGKINVDQASFLAGLLEKEQTNMVARELKMVLNQNRTPTTR